jgi:hypothetical protein
MLARLLRAPNPLVRRLEDTKLLLGVKKGHFHRFESFPLSAFMVSLTECEEWLTPMAVVRNPYLDRPS